jgi:hypothetical protein
MSLETRHADKFVNEVFKDNILLTLAYMDGEIDQSSSVDWNRVKRPATYEFELEPGQTFAYHDDVFDAFKGSLAKTTNAHFNAAEGFKFSGLYFGDGVCHLASLIYWAAIDAGLKAQAPVSHDFAQIPQVPREFGVSIYNMPGQTAANANQNLYITNNKNRPVVFKFEFDGADLKLTIDEAKYSIISHHGGY